MATTPTFLGATQSGSTDSLTSSTATNVVAGNQAGDVTGLFLEMATTGTTPTITWPAGFTEITGNPFVVVAAGSAQHYRVALKQHAGTDSGTYTASWTGSNFNILHAFTVRGADLSGPNLYDAVNTSLNSTASTAVASIALTTSDADLLVFLGCGDSNSGPYDWVPATSPGTFTEVIDNDYDEIAWLADSTSGSRTISGATVTSSIHGQMVLAFKGAAGGAAPTQSNQPILRPGFMGGSAFPGFMRNPTNPGWSPSDNNSDTGIGGPASISVGLTEAAGGTDTVTQVVSVARALSEASGGSDAVSRITSNPRALSEAAGGTDAVAYGTRGFVRTLSETGAGTDSVTRIVSDTRAVSETSGGADTITRGTGTTKTTSETSGGTDTVSRIVNLPRALTEAAAGSDAVARIVSVFKTLTEAAAGSDAVTRIVNLPRALTEAASGVDSVVRSKGVSRPVTDASGGTDTVARSALTFTRPTSETGAGTDSVTRTSAHPRALSEASGGTDSLFISKGISRSVSDTSGGTDATSRVASHPRNLTETANGVDSLTVGSHTTSPVTDAAGGTDSVTRTSAHPRSLTDASGGTDTVSRVLGRARALTEAAGGSDVVTYIKRFTKALTEAAGGTDTVALFRSFFRSVVESAPAVDTVGTGTLVIKDAAKNPRAVLVPPHNQATIDSTDHAATLLATDHDADVVPVELSATLVESTHGGWIVSLSDAVVVQGDTLPPLTIQLTDGITPFDPTSATSVTVKIWQDDVLIVNNLPVSTKAANGVVTYNWQAGDTANAGPIKVRVVCTYSGHTETFPTRGYATGTISPAAP